MSGSSTHPEMATSDHGREPNSSSARTTVENSHVRMMSWAWGRRSMGKTRANRSGSSSQRPAISGVSEEVAQVSITSGSPTKPPGRPRWSSVKPSGASVDGSTGSRPSPGTSGRSKSGSPSSPTGYHTGKGTPKNRCRLMFQSLPSPSTQAR